MATLDQDNWIKFYKYNFLIQKLRKKINQLSDCHSLDAFDDDDLLSIFNLGAESLTELMMAEFSKMATIDAQELAQEFAKQDRQVIPLSGPDYFSSKY